MSSEVQDSPLSKKKIIIISEYDVFLSVNFLLELSAFTNISCHYISYSLKLTFGEAILANLEGIKSQNFCYYIRYILKLALITLKNR